MLIDFTDTLSTLRNTVNLVISLIIILAFVAIFLVNKSLSRNLITPFVVLAENMSNLVSRNEDLSTIDEKLERTDIREINMLLASNMLISLISVLSSFSSMVLKSSFRLTRLLIFSARTTKGVIRFLDKLLLTRKMATKARIMIREITRFTVFLNVDKVSVKSMSTLK